MTHNIWAMRHSIFVEKLLDKTDSKIDDVDIVEMTEAFAAQSIPVKDNLHIPDEKLNIYGGAIALGHPIGASGARLVTTLVNALEQENKRTGIATKMYWWRTRYRSND